MKIKKNTKLNLIIILILTILYIISAARSLNKQYQFIPEWTKDISTTEYSTVSKDTQLAYYKLGQSAGYFTSEGEILSSITYPFKISISDSYYATFNSDSSDIPFYDKFGEKKGQLNSTGYPFFDENRIYVFLPGGSSVDMFNDSGKFLWENESVIPITAFSSCENYTAIGYADGNINIIDNLSGAIITSFNPSGSEYPVILGLNISSNGKYTGCISGQNKQRLVITENVENRQKTIFHKYLSSELKTQTFIKFTKDNSKLIYVCENEIGIYDFTKKKDFVIPIKDNIISMKETDDLIFLLGKTNNIYTVYMIEKTNTLLGNYSFEASNACIQTLNNTLFIGKDNLLSKMIIKKD